MKKYILRSVENGTDKILAMETNLKSAIIKYYKLLLRGYRNITLKKQKK